MIKRNENLVSVIMPAYNSASFIAESIQSVINQSYPHWELIVSDDCSTDNTIAIVSEFQAIDDRIILLAGIHNAGSAVSRNRAIEKATGRYIAFLDSDDLWTKDKLSEQIVFMEKTGCPFSYTSYERIDEDGEVLRVVRARPFVTYRTLLRANVIACLTVVFDTAQLGKQLMPTIRAGQDYAMWLTLLRATPNARGLNQVLGQYRVRSSSISSNKFESSTWVWRIFRTIAGLSLPKALYYFGCYAIFGVASRLRERLTMLLAWRSRPYR